MSSVPSEEIKVVRAKNANYPQVFLFGITIVVCGTTSGWSGLEAGFWAYFCMVMLMGSAFVCLCACLSEMTSVFPFSGGTYGLSRVTLGTYLGFLIGCCESISNIIMVTIHVYEFGINLCTAVGVSSDYDPFAWLFFFVTILVIQIFGGKFFWNFVSGLGLVVLLIVLLYVVSIINVDFEKYAGSKQVNNHHSSASVVTLFMRNFPSAVWLFGGIETVPLAASDTVNVKINIPKGLMLCAYFIFGLAFVLLFIVSSQYPGIDALSLTDFPLVFGFASIYGCTVNQAASIMLPLIFSGGFGPAFVYGRQICSMAESGLFPKVLSKVTKENETPYTALLFGSAIAFVLLPLIKYGPFIITGDELFIACNLATLTIYLSITTSYIIFKRKFSNLTREYRSPYGIYGAAYAMFVFLVAFVGLVSFNIESYKGVVVFATIGVIMSVYFYFHASHTQFFSADEKQVLMSAYVISANSQNKRKIKKKLQRGPTKANKVVNGSKDVMNVSSFVVFIANGGYKSSISKFNNDSMVPSTYDDHQSNVENVASCATIEPDEESTVGEASLNTDHLFNSIINEIDKPSNGKTSGFGTLTNMFKSGSNQNESTKHTTVSEVTDTSISIMGEKSTSKHYTVNSSTFHSHKNHNLSAVVPIELYTSLTTVDEEEPVNATAIHPLNNDTKMFSFSKKETIVMNSNVSNELQMVDV
eukprot:gene10780-14475_t